MASDVDIILEVAVNGIQQVNNLSNAIKQLNRFTEGAVAPIKALDARSRALNQAVGANGVSLNKYAKTVSQLATNQAVLASEVKKVQKEIKGLGASYTFAAGSSKKFETVAIQGLKAYNAELKKIKVRALVEDIKSVAQESKRLGKDMQFVGRSLIIGLTTPITIGMRQALQGLVAFDTEVVRLTKVLEGVAPTAEVAKQKLGEMADPSLVNKMVDSYKELESGLTKVSQKYGLARSLTVGLAADFAELGITSTKNIESLTELTAVAEKLGNMDISNAKDLIQSLYFQSVRTLALTQPRLTAIERETKAIASARAQLNLFNQVENVTALTLRDLGDAFPEVAAAATSFGLSMTEAGAMLAPMKAAGFEIGASANSIKVSLQRITAPTKQNSDMLNALSKQYGVHFKNIKGSGLDALQALTDAYNDVSNSAAGAEGAQEMFAKLFGVRQGPRMEVAIQQLALFDSILKDTSAGSGKLAEKQIQNIANSVISASSATLPLIKNFTDIGILARIATATVDPKTGKAEVEKFGEVTQAQINAAKKARIEIGKEMAKVTQEATIKAAKEGKKAPADLIAQVGTEAGRAMMIQLAGPYTAQQLANQELERALGSLDVQLSIIRNNFKNFTAELITALRPAIQKVVEISQKLYDAWTRLSPETKRLVSIITVSILGAVAAIGPLVFIVGQARLAFGTVTKVLFGFLPGLKTLSIETLAARSAMLKLSKPLTVVGETIVNTNSKFATFIATLASGEGPMARFAQKFGQMSGVLQKTTTAPVPLVKQLDQTRASGRLMDPISGTAPIKKRLPFTRRPSEVEEAVRKRIVRDMGLGSLASSAGSTPAFKKGLVSSLLPGAVTGAGFTAPTGPLTSTNLYDDIKQQIMTSMGFPVAGGRGPGGKFVKPMATLLDEAETMQAAGVTSASAGVRGPGGKFRALKPAERAALKAIEDAEAFVKKIFDDAGKMADDVLDKAKKTAAERMAKSKELATKGVDFDPVTGKTKFKGRDISDQRATDIYRGGVRGMFARTAEAGGRAREAVGARIPKLDLNPINAYKKSIASAAASTATLRAQTLSATGEAPRRILLMRTAMIGFANGTALGTKAIKLMKIALISSGIGAIILAIGVGIMIVKNNMDKFSSAGKKGFGAIGRIVDILKKTFESLARPIVDLFASFGDGEQGAAGAASGIGKAFNGIAVAIEFVAKMVKWFVENIIQPYLYGIVNIVKAIVNIFQGNWMEALKAVGAAFANVFGGAAKVVLTVIGFLVKQVINFFFEIPSGLSKAIAFGVEKATDIFFGFIKWIINQIRNVPVLGKFLGGIGDNVVGGLEKARNVYVGTIRGIANGVNAAGDFIKRGIDTGINAAKSGIDKLQNAGVKKSKGGLDLFGGKTKKKAEEDIEDLGDTTQETIANSTGTGFTEGAEEGKKAIAQMLKDIKKEVQEEIVNRAKSAIESVVDSITQALTAQKEASLKIYDDQIKKINDVAKAEERLTAAKEYEINRRKLLDQRELNITNFRRQRMIAVYEGRIDDARQLALEQTVAEQESDQEIRSLDESRNKELADQKREDLVESINSAKEAAAKYFDDMIKGFTEAAKRITEFPPTTAEEFNNQLEALKAIAVEKAGSMGEEFKKGITSVLPSLSKDSENPLTTALSSIGTIITNNNPFGANGVWQQSIDGAIDYLTQKYSGLSNTMSIVFDENTEKFQKLFDVYKKYKDLMGDTTTSTTGATGGTTGTTTGGGKGGATSGKETGQAAVTKNIRETTRTLAAKIFNDAYPRYTGPSGSVAVDHIVDIIGNYRLDRAKGYTAALSRFTKENKDWNRGIKHLAYQAISKAFSGGKYSFAKGGKTPFMGSGPTFGPVQQGIPAILHGGEYVVRNSAVNKYGWGMLDRINQGTYDPKAYAKGGIVKEINKQIGTKPITPAKKTPVTQPSPAKKTSKEIAQDQIREAMASPAKYAGSAKIDRRTTGEFSKAYQDAFLSATGKKGGIFDESRNVVGLKNLVKETTFDKIGRWALEFSPLGLAQPILQTITGKKLGHGTYEQQSQKVNRGMTAGLSILGIAAGYGIGKLIGYGATKLISKVTGSIGSGIIKKKLGETVATGIPNISDDLARVVGSPAEQVNAVGKALEIVTDPQKIDDYIADVFIHPEAGILEKYGSSVAYARYGDEVTLLTDQYKIGLDRVVFGLDKKFAGRAKLGGVKNVSRNPFEIARVDPMSESAGEIANIFTQAKIGLNKTLKESGFSITSTAMPTTVESLLYASSRGSVKAREKLAELASIGAKEIANAKNRNILTDVGALRNIQSSSFRNLDIEDLYIVHETMFPPTKDALGRLNIRPTGDFQTHFPTFKTIRQNLEEMMSHGNLDPNDKGLVQRYIDMKIRDFQSASADEFARSGGRLFPSQTGDILDSIVYDYTNYYRDTIHTSLNHLVQGHDLRGQASAGGQVIVAKLKDVLNANPRSLENLYPVDTWFTPKPGQGLVIPKGSFEIFPTGPNARSDVARYLESKIDMSKFQEWEKPIFRGGIHGLEDGERAAQQRIWQLADQLGVSSGPHFGSGSYNAAMKQFITDNMLLNVEEISEMAYNSIWRVLQRYSPTGVRGIITKTDPDRFVMSNGGLVPKFASQSVPGLLHGGEFVINSNAVKNIGLLALEAMNNLRFQKPTNRTYQPAGSGETTSTSNINIYVDNFIGEKAWFESMMKEYNVSVVPQNQKNAGLQNRVISTYNGINRGL